MKIDSQIQQPLAHDTEATIGYELQKRSPQAALSHIALVGLSIMTTSLDNYSSTSFKFAVVVIFLNVIRFTLDTIKAIKNIHIWRIYYTGFTVLHSFVWFGFIYSMLDEYKLNSSMAVLAFFTLGGIVSASLFTLGASLKDYAIFGIITLLSPLAYIYQSNQMSGPYFGISIMIVLFGFFILRQRSILYKDWMRLYLYQQEVQDIIDSFPGTISIIRNGVYVMISSKTGRLTGIDPKNFLGKKVGATDKESEFAMTLLDFMNNGLNELTREINFKVASDGNTRKFLLSLNRIPSKPNEFIAIMLDIQDFKDAQHQVELQKMNLQASSKMAALGEMSSGLAHEINNPLAVIVGRSNQLVQMMTSTNQPFSIEKALPVVDKIISTSLRITKIIAGLRSFARDASNDPFEMTSLNEIIVETVAFCQDRIESAGIELKIKNSDSLCNIECRKTQISQVLLNLLNNSHDAILNMQEKWIEIEAIEIQGNILITVTDSGLGIPENAREKLMQPFFTTKEVGKGTGLGLSISRGIIESHHGKFYFDHSSPNTRAVVQLPRLQQSNKKIA